VHEQIKLDEARHFLTGIIAAVDDPTSFRFELSAFLSAARSVLQYACKEAKTKAGGQAWFDNHASNSPVLKFFKDKRNINIHAQPIVPAATINVAASDAIQFSEGVLLQVFDIEGNLISERSSGSVAPRPTASPLPSTWRVYHFSDWTGREDVLQLCHEYVTALETVVNDGRSRGFIT
jgi:hypothetical protein